MLSRTAGNLYWTGRYVERADSMARLLDMGARMTMLPGAAERGDWASVIEAAGLPAPEGGVDRRQAVSVLLLSEDTDSVRASFTRARNNARAERMALTRLAWEALNQGWRDLDDVSAEAASAALADHIDWAQARATAFRGAVETTMLRDDRYDFLILGSLIERAAMTLRLLDVKYLALLPERDVVGGGRDIHQWTSLLLAASGLRAYHHIYRGDVTAANVADLLVLNRAFPRSVSLCLDRIANALDRLASRYEQHSPARDGATALKARLADTTMPDIFADGLHEFVRDTLRQVLSIHTATAESYGFP